MKTRKVWTLGLCKADAMKFKTRNEWFLGSRSAYSAASRRGWFKVCCKHMKTFRPGKGTNHFNFKDITHKVFGSLKAIKPTKRKDGSSLIWEFRCIRCASSCFRNPSDLRITSTCGKMECKVGITIPDLAGVRFGRLKALRFAKKHKNASYWNCICDCGNEVTIRSNCLRQNITKSCGCIVKEMMYAKSLKDPGIASWQASYFSHIAGLNRKKKKLKNYLSKKQHYEICRQNCFYCDAKPTPFNRYVKQDGKTMTNRPPRHEITIERAWISKNGIDRMDNSIGYTKENSVPCCKACNYAKADSDLATWINYIGRFNPSKKNRILRKIKTLHRAPITD